jgi:hypothetical protein
MIYFEELVKKAKLIENPIQKVLAIGGSIYRQIILLL